MRCFFDHLMETPGTEIRFTLDSLQNNLSCKPEMEIVGEIITATYWQIWRSQGISFRAMLFGDEFTVWFINYWKRLIVRFHTLGSTQRRPICYRILDLLVSNHWSIELQIELLCLWVIQIACVESWKEYLLPSVTHLWKAICISIASFFELWRFLTFIFIFYI